MNINVFNAIKTQLETLTSLKHVALWNNQFTNENQEVAHDFPNAFIEFANVEYGDTTNGVQLYSMDVVIQMMQQYLHISRIYTTSCIRLVVLLRLTQRDY